MKTANKPLLPLALLLLPALLVGVAAGCFETDRPPSGHEQTLGSSLAGARQGVSSADAATTQVEPHADATGKELLQTVHADHKQALSKLDEADLALAAAIADASSEHEDNVRLEQQLQSYEDSWSGGKLRRFVRRILLAGTLLTVLVVGMKIFTLATIGPAGGVGIGVVGTIARVLEGFLGPVGSTVGAIFGYFIHRKAIVATAANPSLAPAPSLPPFYQKGAP